MKKIFSVVFLGWLFSFTIATFFTGGSGIAGICVNPEKNPTEVRLYFERQGSAGKIADAIMWPFMVATTGAFESTQRTHFWNNDKFGRIIANELRTENALLCSGLPGELVRKSRADVRFHLPIVGGWKNYIVIEPSQHEEQWFVGWLHSEGGGVSMVPVESRVRLLLGPDDVHFFGVDSEGRQIPIQKVGDGVIGDKGLYRNVPLR